MNTEFFKIQREATFHEGMEQPPDNCSEVLLKFQGIQLKHLTKQLENSDSLNDVNIEAIFHLKEELATVQHGLEQSQEEILSLRGQNAETLGKMTTLQQVIDDQAQQLKNKDAEITKLKDRITEMRGMLERQDGLDIRRKSDISRFETRIVDYQQEIAHLNTENHKLSADITASKEKRHLHRSRHTSEHTPDPAWPITGKEDHTLTAGVASKLLHDLRRDLARTQQEKADLAQKLLKPQEESGRHIIPQTVTHSSTEIYQQIMTHTKPSESIMQCHQVYSGLNLVLSNIPLLKTCCTLEFNQVQEIWSQANAAARDTLVFMWCLGDLKIPLGAMEMLAGSPPFYIKRYILRCIKLLGQHHNMASLPREPLPILKSYSHGQYHLIKKLQQSKIECFNRAITTLAAEDTTICFEAVQQYQTLSTQHPNLTL